MPAAHGGGVRPALSAPRRRGPGPRRRRPGPHGARTTPLPVEVGAEPAVHHGDPRQAHALGQPLHGVADGDEPPSGSREPGIQPTRAAEVHRLRLDDQLAPIGGDGAGGPHRDGSAEERGCAAHSRSAGARGIQLHALPDLAGRRVEGERGIEAQRAGSQALLGHAHVTARRTHVPERAVRREHGAAVELYCLQPGLAGAQVAGRRSGGGGGGGRWGGGGGGAAGLAGGQDHGHQGHCHRDDAGHHAEEESAHGHTMYWSWRR